MKVGIPQISHPCVDEHGNVYPAHLCDACPILDFVENETPAQRLRSKFRPRSSAEHQRVTEFILALGFDKL